MSYIKRTLEKRITEISQEYSCLLLIGPRQVGKNNHAGASDGRNSEKARHT